MRGDDVYPHVASGDILNGRMSEELSREWDRARADSFEPAFLRELTLTPRASIADLVQGR